MSIQEDYILHDKDVAAQIRVAPNTIRKWRMSGVGARFIRAGAGAIRYKQSAVDQSGTLNSAPSTAEINARRAD